MVRYNESVDEWEVLNNLTTAMFPTESGALSFARNACGGGELKIASARMK
jgi:hypothetical protein